MQRSLPEDLQQTAQSDQFRARRETIKQMLLDPEAGRPPDDRPLLVTLARGEGVITIPHPDGNGYCVPAFSSPIHAADYERTLLAESPPLTYLLSSPAQFVRMLSDLQTAGVNAFTIDRCPRCEVFTCLESASMKTAGDVVNAWAVFKATQLALAELYYAYALVAARSGKLETARDVSLDAVAFVTLEDPRLHFLLGEVAIGLDDPSMLNEAREFLTFLRRPQWEQDLAEDERAGVPDFAPRE